MILFESILPYCLIWRVAATVPASFVAGSYKCMNYVQKLWVAI
jgi:hypothetical protein